MPSNFGQIQIELARMAGRPTAADLDDDLTFCKQLINETYLGFYLPVDGVRPKWAKLPMGFAFRAPQTPTITLTQGSKVFTGFVPNADMVGSIVKIGPLFFTYAGLNGANHEFVEAWPEASGDQVATFYHSSAVINASAIEVLGAPELLGVGPLSPMPGRESEVLYRSDFRSDFKPEMGAGYYPTHGLIPSGTTYQTGTPIFYRVESNAMIAGQAINCRFSVLPLPDRAFAVSGECYYVPTELAADGDVPKLPPVIDTIFMPIVRGKWATQYRKYAGENKKELVEAMKAAMAQLKTLANPQRAGGMTCVPTYL